MRSWTTSQVCSWLEEVVGLPRYVQAWSAAAIDGTVLTSESEAEDDTNTVTLADRVALLEDGKVTAVGKHSDLLRESEHYRYVISSLEDEQARMREREVTL